MNEFKLIEHIRGKFARQKGSKNIVLGIGDDCSIIKTPNGFQQVTTVDSLVEGNHFSLKYFTPREIGRKALRVNLSDLASMGATGPYYAWLVFAIPKNVKDSTIKRILDGVSDDCRRYSVTLAGGNLTSSNQFSIHVTLTGWVRPRKALSRSGARVGNLIYVTGTVGPSSVAYRQFKAGLKPDAVCLKRWANPVPKLHIGEFLQERRVATACIDISDGIFQDLGHLISSSGVGAILEWNHIPLAPKLKKMKPTPHTIGFGEDYELLFTVPPKKEKLLTPVKNEITQIGQVVKKGFKLLDEKGRKMNITNIGYSHFT
ncbi:MAG: thiamine-phosphate kinase [Nitrospinota bacterium]